MSSTQRLALGGLSLGILCPFLMGKDMVGLTLLPVVHALTQDVKANTEAVTQAVVEGPKTPTKFSETLLRWLSIQFGLGTDYAPESGLSILREIVARGMVIVCAGATLYALREGSLAFIDYLKKQLTLTVILESNDQPYRWVLQWLTDQPFAQSTHILAVTNFDTHSDKTEEEEGGVIKYNPSFVPGEGVHYFRWRGHWICLERTRMARVNQYGNPTEGHRIIMTLFGKSSARKVVSELIEEALRHSIAKDRSKTVVYVGDPNGYWNRTTVRPIRPMNSVILSEGVAERLLEDVKDYLNKESWYAARGIPYRRGYLLHGSPGCGKTSYINALAGELKLHIYVVNLASEKLNDDVLADLMRALPYRCIILFEDVDAAFVSEREDSDSDSSEEEGKGKGKSRRESEVLTNGITFSGLINTIDGVASQEGRLLFFTTNHYNKLSKTLIRPGRIDTVVEIGLATRSQIRRIFLRFYSEFEGEQGNKQKDADVESLADEFASQVPDKALSMAKLQGYLMQFKYDPVAAVKSVSELSVGM